MYIIRKDLGKTVAFKTYDGWVECDKIEGILDLSDVMLFTEREAHINDNVLAKNERFVYYRSIT